VLAAEYTDDINEISIAQGEDRQTAWHLATLGYKVQLTG